MKEPRRNITLKLSTYYALRDLGRKEDTFDDIVRMLLLEHDSGITFDSYK